MIAMILSSHPRNRLRSMSHQKRRRVSNLLIMTLGASEDKYGAHPEEDTSGRQDNNNFVSNMEFGGNEDVDMDGCKVCGSEGKDVPHSQRDTSLHHRNNIVLDEADRLGVNIMEESSSGVHITFIAKVTFTPNVAHVGTIGETADEATWEMEAESEKEMVPKSQTGIVCVTASVDEAVGEMKEQSEKEVLESHIILYHPELLPEVSPQIEKRRDVMQRSCSRI
nr:uncharacterized protein LOC104091462 isoform X1 [Nicotiana tomentosiformis]XP_033510768.1 uncharacterized protein LOC104091462 isoform X1 [Nicotiana tomentosiformis]XP_033510769.1 uncharacterized protein LOC104091462 isoform X1 [Nicotiana tomentosiformis]